MLKELQSKSHIKLGSSQGNQVSVYIHDYDKKQAKPTKTLQQIYSPDFIKSGDKRVRPTYVSENRQQYRWKQAQALGSGSTTNLRAHHFVLGNQVANTLVTTQQTHFGPKQSSQTAMINSEQQKVKMRAHHHNFEEGAPPVKSSTYKLNYPHKVSEPTESTVAAGDVRKSHIVFGLNNQPYHTTMARDYIPKGGLVHVASSPEFRPLELGTHPQNLISTNQHFLQEYKGAMAKPLPPQTLKEIKGTHFVIGNTHTPWVSETKAEFKQCGGNLQAKRAGHLADTKNLISDSTKCRFQSNYKAMMRPFPLAEKAVPTARTFQTNFVVGNSPTPYTTEFGQHYNLKQGNRFADMPAAGLVCNDKGGDSDSLEVGSDSVPAISVHRADYTLKPLPQRVEQKGKELKSKQTNIRLTGPYGMGNTEYKDQFRDDQKQKIKDFHARMFQLKN